MGKGYVNNKKASNIIIKNTNKNIPNNIWKTTRIIEYFAQMKTHHPFLKLRMSWMVDPIALRTSLEPSPSHPSHPSHRVLLPSHCSESKLAANSSALAAYLSILRGGSNGFHL